MHLGATSFGLIHSFRELYGAEFPIRLLSSLGHLLTNFLQLHGFTLGVEDILLNATADKERKKILSKTSKVGLEAAARAVGLNPQDSSVRGWNVEVKRRLGQAHLSGSTPKRMTIDSEYKKETDRLGNEATRGWPHDYLKPFPDNNLALMIQSGAQGTLLNARQISYLIGTIFTDFFTSNIFVNVTLNILGQVELEGKRPPLMISGRSLPSFLPYDTSPRAGGFVAGCFMTGIRPQEFFFHCMAGRESKINSEVKTASPGYLQRSLVKVCARLNDLTVN
jgi:DNA-directed RNA polymerase I subunit RPA1